LWCSDKRTRQSGIATPHLHVLSQLALGVDLHEELKAIENTFRAVAEMKRSICQSSLRPAGIATKAGSGQLQDDQ
jgi:hypothetical protein